MDSPLTAGQVLDLSLGFVTVMTLGAVGLMALVSSSVRVDETMLPRAIAKAREQFAPPAAGPLPVAAYRWAFRLGGAGSVGVSQTVLVRVLTGSGSLYPSGILVPWAVTQWGILLAWTAWVIWSFLRATSRGGTLPLRVDPPVQPSRYRPEARPAWTDPASDSSSQGRNGIEDETDRR